jgi:threonine synthase
MKLICTACSESYPSDLAVQRCSCGEPVELELIRASIEHGNVWERFGGFFPYLSKEHIRNFSLGEGNTPIVEIPSLSQQLDNQIFFKNETQNPTWSFKDRGTLTGVVRAVKLGFSRIGTVSTGNMAASVSAYGARAGLETTVLVRQDIPEEKIYPILIHGSRLIEVDAHFGEIYRKSLEIGERKGIYFINSDDPFRVEGYKTIGFEIADYFSFNPEIDYIVVPTGSGGLLRGIMKAFRELKASELIREIPEFIAVQAEGCSPIASAFEKGLDEVGSIDNPETIAGAIADPSPPSGNEILRILKKGGRAIAVSDNEILEAQDMLAREGLFVQPASAASLAAVKKLREDGMRDKRIICILTGSGLKVPSAAEKIVKKREKLKIQKTSIDNLEKIL